MPRITKYILTEKQLDYILTANIQDCFEGRWGSSRPSAGTNYFISVRQVLEAEKCLRIKSLISNDKLNLKEFQETFSDISE